MTTRWQTARKFTMETTGKTKRSFRVVETSKGLMNQTNFSENHCIQVIDQYASRKVFLHIDKLSES